MKPFEGDVAGVLEHIQQRSKSRPMNSNFGAQTQRQSTMNSHGGVHLPKPSQTLQNANTMQALNPLAGMDLSSLQALPSQMLVAQERLLAQAQQLQQSNMQQHHGLPPIRLQQTANQHNLNSNRGSALGSLAGLAGLAENRHAPQQHQYNVQQPFNNLQQQRGGYNMHNANALLPMLNQMQLGQQMNQHMPALASNSVHSLPTVRPGADPYATMAALQQQILAGQQALGNMPNLAMMQQTLEEQAYANRRGGNGLMNAFQGQPAYNLAHNHPYSNQSRHVNPVTGQWNRRSSGSQGGPQAFGAGGAKNIGGNGPMQSMFHSNFPDVSSAAVTSALPLVKPNGEIDPVAARTLSPQMPQTASLPTLPGQTASSTASAPYQPYHSPTRSNASLSPATATNVKSVDFKPRLGSAAITIKAPDGRDIQLPEPSPRASSLGSSN